MCLNKRDEKMLMELQRDENDTTNRWKTFPLVFPTFSAYWNNFSLNKKPIQSKCRRRFVGSRTIFTHFVISCLDFSVEKWFPNDAFEIIKLKRKEFFGTHIFALKTLWESFYLFWRVFSIEPKICWILHINIDELTQIGWKIK